MTLRRRLTADTSLRQEISPKLPRMRRPPRARAALALVLVELLLLPPVALANPQGGVVRGGVATITGQGTSVVNVRQGSKTAVLSWQGFDIRPGEVTNFQQPGASAVAINRILDGQASKILGSLNANGHVYLINPNGILFGPNATVNVHALTAATSVKAGDLMAFGNGFDPSAKSAPGARIENQGRITTGTGGFVYLVAPSVSNGESGVIVSPEGEVKLAAGATVLLTDRPDGTALAIEYTAPGAPGAEATNLGKIVADGGLVSLRAELVKQQGSVEANAVRERDGRIELYADSSLTLGAGSVTAATGGDGSATGGTVDAYSAGDATVEEGALVDASGGAGGGAGGRIEVSAANTVTLSGAFHVDGKQGARGGQVVVDPNNVEIIGTQTVQGANDVKISANQTITLQNNAVVSLSNPTGTPTYALHSGGDIVFGAGSKITDAGSTGTPVDASNHWNVQLVAGATDLSATGLGLGTSPSASAGGVYLAGGSGTVGSLSPGNNDGEVSLSAGKVTVRAAGDVWIGSGGGLKSQRGNVDVEAGRDVRFAAGSKTKDGVIETGSGDIRVVAGRDVLLKGPGADGNAAIRTRGITDATDPNRITRTGGGNIFVHAITGDVDAGVGNRWLTPGPASVANPNADIMPVVRGGILGIGTEVGGDVTVIAGGDVRTDSSVLQRTGGSAFNSKRQDGDYTGSHIGVFGREVVDVKRGTTTTTEVLPSTRESRLLVIAGGDISGDYAVRYGRAKLRAGYALAPSVDPATLDARSAPNLDVGLASPTRQIVRSAAAIADPNRGWFGPLSRPVTVDILEGRPIVDAHDPTRVRILEPTVDAAGANGVAIRAIETPSLVYPAGGPGATRRVNGYSPDDSAWLEAEIGDVALIGNDISLPSAEPTTPSQTQPGAFADNALVRFLPPSLKVTTHRWCPTCALSRGLEDRGGDLVLLNDFLLSPSAHGGVTLDLAGSARTANFAALGPTQLAIDAQTVGAASLLSFALPGGTRLHDPVSDLYFTLDSPLAFNEREPARPSGGQVLFRAAPGHTGESISIPAGTRLLDARGRIYRTVGQAEILAPRLRQSEGEVTFFAKPNAKGLIGVPTGTLLVAPDGTVFETVAQGTFVPGQRELTIRVRALNDAADVGHDAAAHTLRLLQPVAGIAAVTNRRSTTRPATVLAQITADQPGVSGDTLANRVTRLLDPIAGIEPVFNPSPITNGVDQATIGLPPPGNAIGVTAERDGPIGRNASGHLLQVVDPSLLPAGVKASQVQLRARILGDDTTLRPVVLKALDVKRDGAGNVLSTRLDPDPGTIASNLGTVWARDSITKTASLKQSDAAPQFDARGVQRYGPSQYRDYYESCHSGAACSVVDPRGQAIFLGSAPTHAGDRSPASLVAKGGFERVRFDLAEAAELSTDGSLLDSALLTQHTAASDVTRILAPNGNADFGAGFRRLRDIDPQTGRVSFVDVPDEAASGLQVSGPGSAEVLIGVVTFDQADTDHDGFIERSEFKGSAAVFDGLNREESIPGVKKDDKLTRAEAPFLPTGAGGALSLQNANAAGNVLGLQTVGNLQNEALKAGGARLTVAAAGDVLLGSRGFIGTIQGGDLIVSSVGGAIRGGAPAADTTTKRGIVTTFTPFGTAQREASTSGGGHISVDSHLDFDIGGLALAALSGSSIRIESRTGSVSAGRGESFSRPLIVFDNQLKEVTVNFTGAGIAASGGNVELVAKKNIDIGAGITGAGITVKAGQNVIAGTGSISSSGSVSINASGTISGNILATGAVSISGGATVAAGSNVSSTGGLVTGAGAVASNTGTGRTSAETSTAADEAAAGTLTGVSGLGQGNGGSSGRRVVIIDVSSRPCESEDCRS
jgi:filamentous hemagglutinin family protein